LIIDILKINVLVALQLRYPALEKTKQNGKTKRNKKDCRPSNNTFGKLYPQANTSFAKRVISANVRSCANLKDEKS